MKAECLQRAIASRLVGFTWSETMNSALTEPSQPARRRSCPLLPRAAARRPYGPGKLKPHSSSREGRPAISAWPSTTPSTPSPSLFFNSPAAKGLLRQRRGGNRAGDRMLGRVLERADEVEHLTPVDARRKHHICQCHLPRRDRSRLVEQDGVTRRVDSSTSGPLIRMPSWAPRPVPTRRAVGVASPRAHGQAMIRTATPAENANAAPAPAPIQKASVATAIAITMGTKTPEIRSARRCAEAFPDCASVTSRAIWAKAVSAPTLVARTMRRPPTLTVAPITASPGRNFDRHALSRQQRPVDRGVPFLDDAVRRQLLAWTNDEPVSDQKLLGGDAPLDSVIVEDIRLLRAQLQQRLEGGAGPPLGSGLEVAPRKDEDGHHGRDLEIDLARALTAADEELEGHPHARIARIEEEKRHDRPAPRGEGPERDQGVHRRGRVLEIEPGRLVERPRAPENDGRRELEREPLPVVELQRLDHRQQQHRQREQRRDDQASPQWRSRIVVHLLGLGRRERRVVAGSLDRVDQIIRRDAQRIEVDRGILGRIVDSGLYTVELVQPLLDPRRAGRARHPFYRELEPLGQGRAHVATKVNGTVCTLPPCRNWRKRA